MKASLPLNGACLLTMTQLNTFTGSTSIYIHDQRMNFQKDNAARDDNGMDTELVAKGLNPFSVHADYVQGRSLLHHIQVMSSQSRPVLYVAGAAEQDALADLQAQDQGLAILQHHHQVFKATDLNNCKIGCVTPIVLFQCVEQYELLMHLLQATQYI